MKGKRLLTTILVLCLCLCACSGREVSTSGSASEQIPSESSPSQVVESLEEPDVSQNTISEPEVVQFEIALHPAAFNEYGHLIVNHENTDTVIVNWTPVSGYAEVDASKTTDQFSPGIQNAEGRLVLDYLRIIHTEGIDVIDYESNIPMRLELFSQVVNSKNYKYFISAMTNGGGGWVNKNRISDDGSTNYGYLFDCKVKLTENDFLNFHYYFQSDKRYQSYDEVPDEVKGELIALIDSFSLHKPQNDTADNTSSPETFLEIINTEYLPIFGSLINCDDWNDAEEIPVSMFYDWYRDYINSVTTHEERIERYKLNSDINSPGWAYPSEEFESHVKQYFDVSTEYLRESSDIYQTDEDVYWAGGGNNITYRTKVESSEDIDVKDGLLVIRVACSLLGDFSDTIYKTLVVDISGEQVKFVSCVEGASGNDNLEEAEAILLDVYKPMITHFPQRIDSRNPISPEDAYYCFQCYAICQMTARNEDYGKWVIKGANEYDLYYSEDVVESFVSMYFGIPVDAVRQIEAYTPDRKGYMLSVYSGKDQSFLNIIDHVFEGDLCTFHFTYSITDYMEAGECVLTLRKHGDGFLLESFEGIIPEF